MDKMIQLSVIIPTRNRMSSLDRTLKSIISQTLDSSLFEVIVVDNGSTDQTKELSNVYASKFKNFKYVYEDKAGLHHGRHAGMRAASGAILTYADDDIEAFPTWLEAILNSFKNPQVDLVGGKNIPLFESSPPQWLLEMWNFRQPEGKYLGYLSILDFGDETKFIEPYFVWGCNFSVRKETLLAAKGFHPDGMPQDQLILRGDGESYISKFVEESGKKAHYNPAASVKHIIPASRITVDYFQRRAYAQGISDSYTDIRYANEKHKSNPKSGYNFLPGMIKGIYRKITFAQLRDDILKVQEELYKSDVRRTLEKSHYQGYHLHQREVRFNPKFMEWIMKPDYLD